MTPVYTEHIPEQTCTACQDNERVDITVVKCTIVDVTILQISRICLRFS